MSEKTKSAKKNDEVKTKPDPVIAEIEFKHIEKDHSIRLRKEKDLFVEAEVWDNAKGGIFIGASTVQQILQANGAAIKPGDGVFAEIHFSPQTGEISQIKSVKTNEVKKTA